MQFCLLCYPAALSYLYHRNVVGSYAVHCFGIVSVRSGDRFKKTCSSFYGKNAVHRTLTAVGDRKRNGLKARFFSAFLYYFRGLFRCEAPLKTVRDYDNFFLHAPPRSAGPNACVLSMPYRSKHYPRYHYSCAKKLVTGIFLFEHYTPADYRDHTAHLLK